MKMKGSFLFLLFNLAVGVGFLIMSLHLPSIEDKLAPLLFSGFLVVLALTEVIKTLWKGNLDLARGPDKKGSAAPVAISPDRLKGIVAWMGGPILGIYLLGFNITIPLFIFSYMKLHKESWITAVIIAGATTAFFVFGFEHFLKIHLYEGLIFELLE